MAKTFGVFKNWSGKVGDIVYSRWKDLQNVREYVVPTDPATTNQQAVRDLFSQLVNLLSPLADDVIKRFWKYRHNYSQSPWSSCIGYNMKYWDSILDQEIAPTFGSHENIIADLCLYNSTSGNLFLEWYMFLWLDGSYNDNIGILVYYDGAYLTKSLDYAYRADNDTTINIGTGLDVSKIKVLHFTYLEYHINNPKDYKVSMTNICAVPVTAT